MVSKVVLPRLRVTLYRVTGEPPLEDGASQVTLVSKTPSDFWNAECRRFCRLCQIAQGIRCGFIIIVGGKIDETRSEIGGTDTIGHVRLFL